MRQVVLLKGIEFQIQALKGVTGWKMTMRYVATKNGLQKPFQSPRSGSRARQKPTKKRSIRSLVCEYFEEGFNTAIGP